jgi:hypothetical protein
LIEGVDYTDDDFDDEDYNIEIDDKESSEQDDEDSLGEEFDEIDLTRQNARWSQS